MRGQIWTLTAAGGQTDFGFFGPLPAGCYVEALSVGLDDIAAAVGGSVHPPGMDVGFFEASLVSDVNDAGNAGKFALAMRTRLIRSNTNGYQALKPHRTTTTRVPIHYRVGDQVLYLGVSFVAGVNDAWDIWMGLDVNYDRPLVDTLKPRPKALRDRPRSSADPITIGKR